MRRLVIATFLLLLLLPAAHAVAGDNASDLLVDACRDEKVDGTYSQRTYKKALSQLPADSDQYTACRDVINRARLAALNDRRQSNTTTGQTGGGAGGGGNTSGGGGNPSGSGSSSGGGGNSSGNDSGTTATAPTPAEQQAVQKAITSGADPVRVGGQVVQPGAVGSLASDDRRLPTSILAMLIVLAVCALGAGGAVLWHRVIARRIA